MVNEHCMTHVVSLKCLFCHCAYDLFKLLLISAVCLRSQPKQNNEILVLMSFCQETPWTRLPKGSKVLNWRDSSVKQTFALVRATLCTAHFCGSANDRFISVVTLQRMLGRSCSHADWGLMWRSSVFTTLEIITGNGTEPRHNGGFLGFAVLTALVVIYERNSFLLRKILKIAHILLRDKYFLTHFSNFCDICPPLPHARPLFTPA